jgi:biopolymer transport protein ExbD
MVDIAFLLLIFYMVTTIFAAPQAMEINLPPKEQTEETAKVKKMNLLNIRVDKSGDIYYDIGKELTTDQDIDVPWKIPADSIRQLFLKYNWDRPKLNTLIMIHPEAKYSNMIDLLDEIELVENMLRSNEAFTKAYLEANPNEEKFSLRYAMESWGAKDDKKMEKVYEQRGGR